MATKDNNMDYIYALDRLMEGLDNRMSRFVSMINAAEAKENKILNKFKNKMGFDNEAVVSYLADIDPTKSKYLYWIIKMFLTGGMILPEDAQKVLDALLTFDKVKLSGKFSGNKDIASYKSVQDLLATVRKYKATNAESSEPTTLRQWYKWVEAEGVKLFWKDSKYTVLLIKKTGQTVEIVPGATRGQGNFAVKTNWMPLWAVPEGSEPAGKPSKVDVASVACHRLCVGTSYCVQDPNTAQSYLNKGCLFAVFLEGDLKYLAEHDWQQFCNIDDRQIAIASVHTCYFLAKMMIDKYDEMVKLCGAAGIKTIKGHLSSVISKSSVVPAISKYQKVAEIPQPAMDKIKQALALGQ